MTLADRIVVMRDGEIEQVGSPMEIYSEPVSYFVADFFGSPSMNLMAGEVVHDDGARALPRAALRRRLAGALQGRAAPAGDARHPAGACRGAQREDGGAIELPLRLVEPLGKDTLLYFDDGTERAFVAVSEGLGMPELKVGTPISLEFDPRRLYVFGADGRRMRSGFPIESASGASVIASRRRSNPGQPGSHLDASSRCARSQWPRLYAASPP